jgi:hypothetical protein
VEPAELSAASVLFLLFDLVVLLPLSAAVELAELSAASVLFLLFDLVLLLLAVESVPLCEESSAVFFFVVFFVVVELSLWSCVPDELACRALATTAPEKSSHVASHARTAPLLDLISAPSLLKQGLHNRSISASSRRHDPKQRRPQAAQTLQSTAQFPPECPQGATGIRPVGAGAGGKASGMPCGTSLADERIILKIFT